MNFSKENSYYSIKRLNKKDFACKQISRKNIQKHPKTSYELFKIIRQAEKVVSNSSFYSDI